MRNLYRAVAVSGLVWSYSAVAVAAEPTGLFAALKQRDHAAIAALVERGVDVNSRNDAGQTALMLAAAQPDGEKLIELLTDVGADPQARDVKGMTALMHAAANGQRVNAEQLIQQCADPGARDSGGKSVADHARAGGLDERVGNRPSFASMLRGENHKTDSMPAYTYYIPLKGTALDAASFQAAARRAFLRKNWCISEASGTVVQAHYARTKNAQLYKAEVVLEPGRIAIRYRAGFGTYSERTYLEGIKFGLAHELALY
jgi:hypothetical protein